MPSSQANYGKTYYRKRRDAGLCHKCGGPSDNGSRCFSCAEVARIEANEKVKLRKNAGVCIRCGGGPLDSKNHCRECREITNAWKIRHRAKVVNAVLDHYGRQCACCGESIKLFLTIDHMNGGGRLHRIDSDIYRTLYNERKHFGEWPDGFRTLCYNCNSGRWRNGGECPHKEVQNA